MNWTGPDTFADYSSGIRQFENAFSRLLKFSQKLCSEI